MITIESAFLIRTLFFFIFGYSLLITSFLNLNLLLTASIILIILYGIRFLYLRFAVGRHIFPELFIAPRGLITILLFYSIPEEYSIGIISEGLLFTVILLSSLIMMIGLMLKSKSEMDVHLFSVNNDLDENRKPD